MKSFKNRALLAVAFMLAALSAAYGQYTPTDDAYTNTAAPTTNFGAATTLAVVNPSQTSFVIFDLSSVPAGYTGANVAKASLKLFVNTVTTAGSFNVDYVNGAWSEKSITANLSPALGTTIAASVPLAKANARDYILVDVTPAVVAWLNGSQANDGLALVGNSPLSVTFDSKENSSQSHPPELDIVLTGGGSGTITGVTAGSGLVGGGTTGNVTLSMLNTCSSGQVLQWNGATWACSSAGSGTITGVTAGADLTGGGTSGNVTLNIDTTKIPLLASANTFAQPQAISSSAVTSLTVNSSSPTARVIYGHATNTASGPAFGILGGAEGVDGVGVWGFSNGAGGYGVQGKGATNGVLGWPLNNSTIWNLYSSVGVHGDNGATNGIGVLGTEDGGYGVKGISDGTVINTAGTYGAAGPPSGFGGIAGVWGDAANHVGTYGSSVNFAGVLGESRGSDGVRGISHAMIAAGVSGTSDAPGGIGVYGGTSGGGPAGYFAGNVAVIGKITSYNNTTTVANGVPSIVFQFSFSSGGGGQNIYQDLYTPSSDGIFRITAFEECTATSGGGTFFSMSFLWTLPTNGSSGNSVFGPDCSSLNGSSGTVVAHVKGGTPIQYNYVGMNAPFQTLILIERLL
jgi:hypothetical protein